jgi:outer membrane protein assembly factor BamB
MAETPNALQAVDPATGERIWWCKGSGESAMPIYANGLVFFDSGRGGRGTLVDPAGAGDVSATHVKADVSVAPEAISSPVVHDKLMFRLVSPSQFKCWELETGKLVYNEKIPKATTLWGSPVVDPSGKIFLATAGKSYVIQAGREYKLLATNDLGDEGHTSPAVAGGKMFLLGWKNLYCIGTK